MEQSTQQGSVEHEILVPGLNTQVVFGLVIAGLWAVRTNNKLRTLLNNQRTVNENVLLVQEQLGFIYKEGLTVKDVVRLAAAATDNTKGA